MEAAIIKLVEGLRAEIIISNNIISNLRNYIYSKSPSANEREFVGIFADAINRMLDSKINFIPEKFRAELRKNILKEATKKKAFEINGADIFEASLIITSTDKLFFEAVGDWVSSICGENIEESVIMNISEILIKGRALHPEKSIRQLLSEYVENKTIDTSDATEIDFLESNIVEDTIEDVVEDTILDIIEEEQVVLTEQSIVQEIIIPEANEYLKNHLVRKFSLEFEWKALFNTYIIKRFNIPRLLELFSQFKENFTSINYTIIQKYSVSAVSVLIIIGMLIYSSHFTKTSVEAKDTDNKAEKTNIISEIEQEKVDKVLSVEEHINSPELLNGLRNAEKINMSATAYDLSVESCGKQPDHPQYGITSSGKRAQVGRTVAIDPSIIPLGQNIYIEFPEKYNNLNGVYLTEDTGRLVKGNRVDIFFGEDKPGERIIYKKALEFGIQNVLLYIVDN